jgi:hypothetical protein
MSAALPESFKSKKTGDKIVGAPGAEIAGTSRAKSWGRNELVP